MAKYRVTRAFHYFEPPENPGVAEKKVRLAVGQIVEPTDEQVSVWLEHGLIEPSGSAPAEGSESTT